MAWALTQLQDAEDFDGQRPIPVGSTLTWDGSKFLVVPPATENRVDARYSTSVNEDLIDAGNATSSNPDLFDSNQGA